MKDSFHTLRTEDGAAFAWDAESTYFQRPPFFDLPPLFREGRPLIAGARPLLILGDSVTTDHISPVGGIAPGSPAAEYLEASGVARAVWNAYGARRGNHEVMVRGTFANPRLRNELADAPGGLTRILPEGKSATVHEAAEAYAARGEPAVVLAGRMYGAGSARDWAAKGTRLLGVAAIIAESFERIHRSNLVRMAVLPLEFADGATREGIGPGDRLSVDAPLEALTPLARLELRVVSPDGAERVLPVRARVDTRDELRYLRHGGILPAVAETTLGQTEPVA